MKITVLIALASLALVVTAGCIKMRGGSFHKRSDKIESLTLQTHGEPGQHFTATLDVDGVKREFSGVTPAELPLQACVLSGTLRKTEGPGTLRLRVLPEGGGTLTFGRHVTSPGDSFHFRYHARGVEVWN